MSGKASRRESVSCMKDGTRLMSSREAEHLRAAIGQMDLLLVTPQVDAAMDHLVAMLRHMLALRRMFS